MILRAAVIIVFAVVWLVVVIVFAHAHDAPGGWTYPPNCCGGSDCHEVQCEAITKEQTALGPEYVWNGIHFPQTQHQYSPDGKCHVCAGWQFPKEKQGGRIPRCIFTPPPAST